MADLLSNWLRTNETTQIIMTGSKVKFLMVLIFYHSL